MHKRQLQNALALIVEGVTVHISYSDEAGVSILNYIHQCMLDNSICTLKNNAGAVSGIFRGQKISGVYPTQVDATLQNLQIENLDLQNTQLKSSVKDEFWKHGKEFD